MKKASILIVSLILCIGNVFSQNFITGIKIENTDAIQELNLRTFEIAYELEIDCILVPITYKYENSGGNLVCRHDTINDTWDWSSGLNYDSIFSLAGFFDINILPAFYKLGGADDINEAEYGNFVKSFISEFYYSGRIKYIEFQNEPVIEYNGFVSLRFKGTPTDLRLSNNAAYDSVKTSFPDIIVGTAGFIASSVSISENTVMNDYYNEYFGSGSDTLKFDVLTIHHYPRNGAYFQTSNATINSGEFNFMSEANIYQSYRDLLNSFGYNNCPIFITEGCIDLPFDDVPPDFNWFRADISSVLLIEKYLLACRNQNLNIIGTFVSNIVGAKESALFSYNETTGVVSKTNKFYTYKYMLEMMKKYPVYDNTEHGYIDSTEYIVDHFVDSLGNSLRTAFCPVNITTTLQNTTQMAIADTLMITPQITDINISSNVDFINISSVSYCIINTQTLPNLVILQYSLGRYPIFIEDSTNTTEINEIGDNDNIKIYPNPTNGIFTIKGKDLQSIEVINISGQTIKQLSINNKQLSIINLKGQPKGVYMIKIVTDKGTTVKKVVLE